jgi:hypothetical protein
VGYKICYIESIDKIVFTICRSFESGHYYSFTGSHYTRIFSCDLLNVKEKKKIKQVIEFTAKRKKKRLRELTDERSGSFGQVPVFAVTQKDAVKRLIVRKVVTKYLENRHHDKGKSK